MTLWFLTAATMHTMEHTNGKGNTNAARIGWYRAITNLLLVVVTGGGWMRGEIPLALSTGSRLF
jgi:hypothetical protein